jgi:hypothetical protein
VKIEIQKNENLVTTTIDACWGAKLTPGIVEILSELFSVSCGNKQAALAA